MSKIVETFNKGSCIEAEASDLTAVAQLAEESLRRTCGRLAKYEDSPVGLERFMDRATEYFAYVNKINSDPDLEKKLIPDVESLCIFLGITRKTMSMYHRRGEAWANAIDLVKDALLACKKQLASTHRMPPLIYIFDAVNNFNYHNVAEFHLTAEPPQDASCPAINTTELQGLAGTAAEPPQLPIDIPE